MACYCGSSNKDKGKGVVGVEEVAPKVLGSPIQFHPSPTSAGSSNSSYLTPPIANESSSTLVAESLVSPLVLLDDEDKESQEHPGIGAVIAHHYINRLLDGPSVSQEFVRETCAILQEHSLDIVMVCGQCVFRSLGPPKSCFNPYTTICCLCSGCKFLCQLSCCDCHVGSADDKLSSV